MRQAKHRKDRGLFVTNEAKRALVEWLAVRGTDAGPLFHPVDKVGRIPPRRLTAQAVYAMLKQRAREAGVADFSPHDLRRTLLTDLQDAGVDLSTVAGIAGHANVATTARYDRRGDDAKRKALELVHVPYESDEAKEESVVGFEISIRPSGRRAPDSGLESARWREQDR